MINTIKPELMNILDDFTSSRIGIVQLRGAIDRQFFSDNPESPIDREVIGELYIALSEFDNGLLDESDIVTVACELLQKAHRLAEQESQQAAIDIMNIPVHTTVNLDPLRVLKGSYIFRSPDVQYQPSDHVQEMPALTLGAQVSWYPDPPPISSAWLFD